MCERINCRFIALYVGARLPMSLGRPIVLLPYRPELDQGNPRRTAPDADLSIRSAAPARPPPLVIEPAVHIVSSLEVSLRAVSVT
jgi:hypothetical protein